jgi:hypothetical protein
MIATFFDSRMKVERHYNRFCIRTSKGQKMSDAILVIVDRLTKSALFLLMKMTDLVDKLAKLFIDDVVRLHEVPISIISNKYS